jgi:hypothetical protein
MTSHERTRVATISFKDANTPTSVYKENLVYNASASLYDFVLESAEGYVSGSTVKAMEREGALDDHRRAIALVQEAKDPQQVLMAYGAAVLTLEEYGMTDEARHLANDVVPLSHISPDDAVLSLSFDFLSARVALEYEQELREALGKAPLPELRKLAFACLDRDFVRAADMWADAGSPTFEARLRLRAAEHLAEVGQKAAAREQAEKAAAFYRSVAATALLERAEALIRASRES